MDREGGPNVGQSGTRRPDEESGRLGIFKCTQDKVVSNFQSSPFDKLRAGSAGVVLLGRIPSTACWAKFSRPFGTGSDVS